MKKALYVGLIVIALGLFYVRVRYSSTAPASSPAPEASVTPTASLAPASPVLSEQLDNAYFTLSYPEVATYSARTAPDSREWVISYMGEDQKNSGRTQTELWDGYVVTITRFEVVGDEPDQTQAQADIKGIIDACGVENTTEIKSGKLGDYETLTFYGGCLGEADHHYLMLADTLYRVTIMLMGDDRDQPTYRSTTQSIINTLKFK